MSNTGTTASTTERAEFIERVEQRIKDTLKEFQDLELAQMRKGEIEARATLAAAKEAVDEKRGLVDQKVKSARRATSGAWTEAREGLEAAWSELRDAVDRARQELEQDAKGASD